MTGRLAGRVLLVTGSTGIGGATARRAAGEGASVFVVSRTDDHARALAESLPDGGWAAADLEDEAAVEGAVSAALEHFGRIDSLFSAMGGSGRRFGDGPLHTITGEAWDATLRLNLRSHALVCGRVIRAMLERTVPAGAVRGSIVLVGSVLATSPVPEHFATHAYAAAKGGLHALMTSLAATYARDGIRVNLVAPSLTDTAMAARAAADPRILEYTGRKQPLAGPLLEPDDVAAAAIFLLSDESRMVTGQALAVDGGWSVVSPPAGPTP